MSLLEDVFLEDEAGEAQDLERIIEGDGFDEQERNSDDDDDGNAEGRDDEAEEDKRRVDPTSATAKKVVRNPRFVLNPARLTGPRGIQVIPEHFKNFKFKGKGHEKDDLDMVLKKLEHWAYRLYPKFKFEDCLKKMEMLGKKRTVMVHLHKIRSDQYISEDTITQQDSSDDEAQGPPVQPPVVEDDEFDKLLQQQIELAHTPAGKRVLGSAGDIGTPMSMPKATSSPSISEEQKQRMLQNRAKAEERRLAKLKAAQADQESVDLTANDKNVTKERNNEGSQINLSEDKENSNVMDIDDQENSITKETNIDLTKGDYSLKKSIDNNSVNSNINGKPNYTESVVDLTEITDIAGSINRKSNIIDDSDDDAKLSYEESDILKNKIDMLIGNKTGFNNKTDKTVFSDDVTVDLTEIGDKQGKRTRKANVIDSSDDDCDVTAEDISITVDIHRENSQTQKGKESMKDTNVTNKLTLEKDKNNESLEENDKSMNTNNDEENMKEKRMKCSDSASLLELQEDCDDIAKRTNTNGTNEDRTKKQMNGNENVTRDSQNDEDASEKSNNNITNEHHSEKQNNIEEIEASDDQIDEHMTERSDIESNTMSDNIVNVFMEKQANARAKEAVALETAQNVKESKNSLDNIDEISLAEDNLVYVNKEQISVGSNSEDKISIDEVMDVDFSEEF